MKPLGDGTAHERRAELTFRENQRSSRHGWLRLTPAYSLHLVRALLCELDARRDRVLDPFSGTGTTALASAAAGIPAAAVDLNPLLVWLGNLKLARFTERDARAAGEAAARIARALRRRTSWGGAWRPDLHRIEKWWDAPVLDVLAQLCAAVERQERARDLLRIAFCQVMIDVAHVSFGHQSMSFRRAGARAAGVVARPVDAVADDVCERFVRAAAGVAASTATEVPRAAAEVFLGDARELGAALPRADYTAVITSPPYPNRMSYIRELRPYMYWLRFLTDGRAAGALDWQAIGGTWGSATSNLARWQPDGATRIPFPGFAKIVGRIGARHPLLGRYVEKYFADIARHLASLQSVLSAGARLFYIVGNSKFYDTLLPVEEIYAALLRDAGFVQVSIERMRKRSSKKELFEFVVRARTRGRGAR
jgi:hypothetical protein